MLLQFSYVNYFTAKGFKNILVVLCLYEQIVLSFYFLLYSFFVLITYSDNPW